MGNVRRRGSIVRWSHLHCVQKPWWEQQASTRASTAKGNKRDVLPQKPEKYRIRGDMLKGEKQNKLQRAKEAAVGIKDADWSSKRWSL